MERGRLQMTLQERFTTESFSVRCQNDAVTVGVGRCTTEDTLVLGLDAVQGGEKCNDVFHMR